MSTESMEEILSTRATADQLYDELAVEKSIQTLAAQVTADCAELNPILLFALNGGCYLGAKLMEKLDFPLQVDVLQLTRYQNQLTGGQLQTGAVPAIPLHDRHLLIIDDILDQGVTLQGMVDFCRADRPASIRTLVLINKECDRAVDISADYVGLTAPDRYLFGCGMDYKGYWRNLPAIYAVVT